VSLRLDPSTEIGARVERRLRDEQPSASSPRPNGSRARTRRQCGFSRRACAAA